jgi:hypothetical protein
MSVLKAAALVIGPLVCGALFFWRAAPPQRPGAYVEAGDAVYALGECEQGSTVGAPGVPLAEVVAVSVLLPNDSPAAVVAAESARLYLKVVDHAHPAVDYSRVPLESTVRRMQSRVFRVAPRVPLRWEPDGALERTYREALAHTAGTRSAMEVLLQLEVPAPGGSCVRSVSLGAPR